MDQQILEDAKTIQAVFFDVDHTFYDHGANKVFAKTIEACQKMQAKGIKVFLCSGRPYQEAKDIHLFDYMDYDGYIGCSGGIAYDAKQNVIYEHLFTDEQLKEIFAVAKAHDLTLLTFGQHQWINKEVDEEVERVLHTFHLVWPKVHEWNHEKIDAMACMATNDDVFEYFKHIEGLSYTRSNDAYIDFKRVGTGKAEAIKTIMANYGLEAGAFIAFGDSMNDIDMIKDARIGIAMQNATQKLKEAADLLCGPCYEEASIFNILKELGIID